MKKSLFILFSFLLFSCNFSRIKYIENNYDLKFPKNFEILKDSIEGEIDYIVIIDIRFISNNDFNNVVNQLNKKTINKDLKYELLSKDLLFTSSFKIDTINKVLSFKEYHY